MSTLRVASLGYLVLGVSDLDAWSQYAQGILGVCVYPGDDALLLRYDSETWRVKLAPSGEDDVTVAGFSVADVAALGDIASRLTASGVAVEAGSPALCRDRGVDRLVSCKDPDGLAVELYVGARPATEPLRLPRDLSGFVTGDQGLGHMVISVSDIAKAEAFYRDGLGFLLSDHITLGPPDRQFTLTFLHCNRRHHTLALLPVPTPKRLNHIMVQVGSLDEVGTTLDLAMAAGTKISSGLGKHTNDRMTSFYMKTPSGFDIEFGYGGVEIDDAVWQTTSYNTASIWGHRPV